MAILHIDVSMSREKNKRVRPVGPDPIPRVSDYIYYIGTHILYGSNFKYNYYNGSGRI